MKWKIDQKRKDFLEDKHQGKILVSGRRFGKTMLGLMFLCYHEFQPNERRWLVFPTYRQGKMVAWNKLKSIFRGRNCKINEVELSVTLPNGAEISIRGADREDSLRGVSLGAKGTNAVVLDEYAYMKPNVLNEIIMPMLAETQANIMICGTPDGVQNHLFEMYNKGQNDDPYWKSWQYTTIEGGFIPLEEIEKARQTLDARTFKQEMEGSFEVSANRCAYNFDRSLHVKDDLDIPYKKYWGIDFGVASYMSAVLIAEFVNGDIYVIDEIAMKNSNTFELAKAMRGICPSVECYPDPAGKARTSNSTRSDHMILLDNGFLPISRKKNPTQRDRLNALNKKLKDANGKPSLFIKSKCKMLIRDLEMTTMQNGQIYKTEDLSHMLDSLCYPIEMKFPLSMKGVESISW